MKNIKYLLLIIMALFAINVYADDTCDSNELARVKELAKKVEFDYSYVVNDDATINFSIEAVNLNRDLEVVIVEDYYNQKYREFKDNASHSNKLDGFRSGERVVITINAYVPNRCSGKTVLTKTIKLPYYNITKTDTYFFKKTDPKDYNVLDTNFDIEKDNKELLSLSKYLKGTHPTNKNKYTGIFENKNLIFITAESFSFSFIDKDLTPTLYKLKDEGFNFENFYTPIYYASTSDGEYTNLTGLLPREGTWSLIDSKNNDFFK